MLISKLNSKYIFKYPFDGGKKLSLAECFERNKIAHFFVCLSTVNLISVSVLPTNYSKVQ